MEKVVWSKWLMENEGTAEEESLGELDGSYISTGLKAELKEGEGERHRWARSESIGWPAGWLVGWYLRHCMLNNTCLHTVVSSRGAWHQAITDQAVSEGPPPSLGDVYEPVQSEPVLVESAHERHDETSLTALTSQSWINV
jgi:hypothetical protein